MRRFKGQAIAAVCTVSLVLTYQNCGDPYSLQDFSSLSSPTPQAFHHGEKVCGTGELLAFPGATGFGKYTRGGRGGEVVHVTNLNDTGKGSLRWALESVTGPRTIVFDIEGRISLSSEIQIRNPFVTIAGQSAPGAGVVISGARISVRTHDVIVRGLRMRAGDDRDGDIPKNRDNFSIGGNGVSGVHNIIVDHNSFTWSVDESVALWGTSNNVTISNNIIAESLYDSIHIDEGKTAPAPHSMGFIVGHKNGDANLRGISISRNLFASNKNRNPMIKGADDLEFVNNFITNYGAGHQGMNLGGGDTPLTVAVVGNYYEDGVDTSNDARPGMDLRSLNAGSKVYMKDNFVEGHREGSGPEDAGAHGKTQMVVSKPFFALQTPVLSSSEVPAVVLANAGARLKASGLDPVDARIVQQAQKGTSRIIDSPRQVGGFGVYNFGNRKVVDSDNDGIPDDFERQYAQMGFNPSVADSNKDSDGDGYTNLEEYLNGLIDGFQIASCGGSTSTPPPAESSQQPAPAPTSPSSNAMVVEAESMLLNGFEVVAESSASGGSWIQAKALADASMNFEGASGRYKITVRYYDENDGISSSSLSANGKLIGSWKWDMDLGSHLANSSTHTSKVFDDVYLAAGDRIVLSGQADAGEPHRVDYISFEKLAEQPVQSAPVVVLKDKIVHAESMVLDGFQVKNSGVAENGAYIQASNDSLASAHVVFDGNSGVYNIEVFYFDENDGKAQSRVLINNNVVEQWTWNQQLGSHLANSNTLTSRKISNVKINKGDKVKIEGLRHTGEALRIDTLAITPANR